jgi:hypothetical protein
MENMAPESVKAPGGQNRATMTALPVWTNPGERQTAVREQREKRQKDALI